MRGSGVTKTRTHLRCAKSQDFTQENLLKRVLTNFRGVLE